VEDEEMIRAGLRLLVDNLPHVRSVGEAKNGHEALPLIKQSRPNVVLTDVVMPFVDGIRLTREVRKLHPETAVVILTSHSNEAHLSSALEAGAAGYLLKGSAVDELRIAIQAVANGKSYITPDMTQSLVSECRNRINSKTSSPGQITPRQRQTLRFIVEGRTNKEIAARLNISPKTVEKHRSALLRHAGVHNSAELVWFAVENSLL
jgi:DNA-binding NarL/FixJ family response regulator